MKKVLLLLMTFGVITCMAQPQDSLYVRAHFLFGSKPKHKYRKVERKWFGGVLGGHAGVEITPNYIIDFGPRGKFHVFSHRNNRHSGYAVHDTINFYELFGTERDSVQRMSITIPVTAGQKKTLDSLAQAYLRNTPYDYAFIGMRCGAAAYDVLANAGIVKQFGRRKTYRKIFYPRKLRRRLMKEAWKNGWKINYHTGGTRRRWEKK